MEVCELDLEHWDAETSRILVRGKGETQRKPITVNARTADALAEWLKLRGPAPGPLFTRLDKARAKGGLQRLDKKGVNKLINALGDAAKIRKGLWPHALRHEGITRILQLNRGDIIAAQKAARHKDPKTTIRYNDALEDVAGKMAKRLGDDA